MRFGSFTIESLFNFFMAESIPDTESRLFDEDAGNNTSGPGRYPTPISGLNCSAIPVCDEGEPERDPMKESGEMSLSPEDLAYLQGERVRAAMQKMNPANEDGDGRYNGNDQNGETPPESEPEPLLPLKPPEDVVKAAQLLDEKGIHVRTPDLPNPRGHITDFHEHFLRGSLVKNVFQVQLLQKIMKLYDYSQIIHDYYEAVAVKNAYASSGISFDALCALLEIQNKEDLVMHEGEIHQPVVTVELAGGSMPEISMLQSLYQHYFSRRASSEIGTQRKTLHLIGADFVIDFAVEAQRMGCGDRLVDICLPTPQFLEKMDIPEKYGVDQMFLVHALHRVKDPQQVFDNMRALAKEDGSTRFLIVQPLSALHDMKDPQKPTMMPSGTTPAAPSVPELPCYDPSNPEDIRREWVHLAQENRPELIARVAQELCGHGLKVDTISAYPISIISPGSLTGTKPEDFPLEARDFDFYDDKVNALKGRIFSGTVTEEDYIEDRLVLPEVTLSVCFAGRIQP